LFLVSTRLPFPVSPLSPRAHRTYQDTFGSPLGRCSRRLSSCGFQAVAYARGAPTKLFLAVRRTCSEGELPLANNNYMTGGGGEESGEREVRPGDATAPTIKIGVNGGGKGDGDICTVVTARARVKLPRSTIPTRPQAESSANGARG
jgi:hypothetical protein